MSILSIASVGSSPGVTTLTVALSLQWARPSLLVEADVSKPSSVVPGFLQGAMPADSGLMGVAQTSGMDPVSEADVFDFAVDLMAARGIDAEGQPSRLLLPALSEPVGARQMRSFWTDLMRVLRQLGEKPVDTLIDLGRIEEMHGRTDLVTDSDHLCLLMRSDLGSVAAVKTALEDLEADRASRGAGGTISLVVVDELAHKLSSREISKFLGAPVIGRVPHAPQAAAFYSGGARVGKRPLRRFDAAAHSIGATLVQTMDQRRAEMEGETK